MSGNFPPSNQALKHLDLAEKELYIDTANWPAMRKLIASKTKDPHSPDFDWTFWCGILTEEDWLKFVEEYNETAAYAKHFENKDGNNSATINKIIDDNVKSHSLKQQEMQRAALKETISQINTDSTRWGTDDQNIINVIRRVLFTIYINKYTESLHYTQGEGILARKLYEIAQVVKPGNIEPMLYKLLDTLLFKCSFKLLFFPCTQLTINHTIFYFYNYKKLSPHKFIDFLFISMLMKYRKDIFKGLSEKSDEYRNKFFTELCGGGLVTSNVAKSAWSLNNLKKVIGDTLVFKNVLIFFSYILSTWVQNFPNFVSYTPKDPSIIREIESKLTASDSNILKAMQQIGWEGPTGDGGDDGTYDGRIFLQLLKRVSENIYGDIDSRKMKEIVKYLQSPSKYTGNSNMLWLVNLAKKKFKHGREPTATSPSIPTFTIPTSFINRDPTKKKKKKQTKKKSTSAKSKKKTLKKSKSAPS